MKRGRGWERRWEKERTSGRDESFWHHSPSVIQKRICIAKDSACKKMEQKKKEEKRRNGQKTRVYDCFHTSAKCAIWMIILNYAIWMIIRMTVFWTGCMQIYIAMINLNCAIQMMVRRCFLVTHLSNHAAKSPYECLDLWIMIWGGGWSYVTF